MAPLFKASLLLLAGLVATPSTALAAPQNTMWKFDFGSGNAAPGYTKVTPHTLYTAHGGFGFENAADVVAFDRGGADTLRGDGCTSEKPFLFSVAVPEGNYHVSLMLGDAGAATATTVKAESRRLMLENVQTAPGQWETRAFTVNVRNAKLKSGGTVRLKAEEQQNHLNWDEKLTLEFNGARPTVCTLEISRADDAVTVYLAGDSTVTDQKNEPWAAWGQMLPRFFKAGVSVANHAQSGEALFSFKSEKRLEKILETIKAGDYLFIQFGHNDQKDKSVGAGPFTSYRENLKYFVAQARQKNAIPILISPMERRRFEGNTPLLTLADYAEAVRQVGREESVPVIDLHAMSLKLYAALGPDDSKKAFVHYAANSFPGQAQPLKDGPCFRSDAEGAREPEQVLLWMCKLQKNLSEMRRASHQKGWHNGSRQAREWPRPRLQMRRGWAVLLVVSLFTRQFQVGRHGHNRFPPHQNISNALL